MELALDNSTIIDKGNNRIRKTLESWHTAKNCRVNAYLIFLCHHFASKRDFERDAQRVCRVERSLKRLLAGRKRQALCQTNQEQCN